MILLEIVYITIDNFHFLPMQLIGDGAIAQVVTSNTSAGGFLTVNVGYGIGLIVGLYVSIGVSGGHLNPAVTLAMALRGKLSWLKVKSLSLSLSLSSPLPPYLSLPPSLCKCNTCSHNNCMTPQDQNSIITAKKRPLETLSTLI